MFKLRPKAELKFLVVAFSILGSFLLIGSLVSVPAYLKYAALAGGPVTITADGYRRLLTAFGLILFCTIPAISLILLITGWRIRKISRCLEEASEHT